MNQKQSETFQEIVAAILTRRPELTVQPTFTASENGNNLVLSAVGWPEVTIGKQGGINVTGLNSYKEDETHTALDAVVFGDQLLAKQKLKAEKKASAAQSPDNPNSETIFAPGSTDEEPHNVSEDDVDAAFTTGPKDPEPDYAAFGMGTGNGILTEEEEQTDEEPSNTAA